MKNARYVAFCMLCDVEKSKAYSNLALNKYLLKTEFDKKDKNLITGIFYGTLEHKITLDYLLKPYSKKALEKLDTEVLVVLRMSIFQIVYMDKVPDNAVVNEAVDIIKRAKKKSASGFINAVLRSFILNKKLNDNTLKSLDNNLSVKYSVNPQIIKLWQKSYSKEKTTEILEAFSSKPKLFIRVNTLKTDVTEMKKLLQKQNISCVDTVLQNALTLQNIGNISSGQLFLNGYFSVQGLSSQLCAMLLNAKAGNTVYDVCSAPGGKAVMLAQIMKNDGKIFAFDLHNHRVELVKKNADRIGATIINAVQNDAVKLDCTKLEKADRVLCDVPCSGLGEIKHKPEIRYKDLSDMSELYSTQYKILCNASKLLKKGGILLYSTCTLNPKENNEIADKFLFEHKNFAPCDIKAPAFVKRNSFEPSNQITIFPDNNFDDGFFIAMFKRRSE